MRPSPETPNFGFLEPYGPALVETGALAERYFPDDPVTALMRLRQFGELLAQEAAARFGLYSSRDQSQADLLGRLKYDAGLPRDLLDLFHFLRRVGNQATHHNRGDHETALEGLKVARQLGIWLHRTFSDPGFKAGPFQPPQAPRDETAALREEMLRLQSELDKTMTEAQLKERRAVEAESARLTAEERLRKEAEEREFWERYAAEAEAKASSRFEELQIASAAMPPALHAKQIAAAAEAAKGIDLDEAATRAIIDEQLRDAGWEADTREIRHANGTRPVKGRNMAIAEWPTASGPADYALFIGTICVGVVEAKRKRKSVSAAIDQAERYSQTFNSADGVGLATGSPWPAESGVSKEPPFKIPLVFATNGRAYLKQLHTESGIWFRDARSPKHIRRALMDWMTPDGIRELLASDQAKAQADLAALAFDFGFDLRPYQEKAIRKVEDTLNDDSRRTMLLAMATGTGKTKLAIAMLYRLLATKRFRRVCFVVDRTSLGDQAAGEFTTTRIVGPRTFAEIFGLKDLREADVDPSTKVHICTIQGLVKRVLNTDDPKKVPAVDQYDLIVVDECHRGYLLDREMSDAELAFRSEADYVSKYRRVLEHFDAVKIGLTATPALHTTEIFGEPVYTYSYREAVIDGWLCDHDPPLHIHTALSRDGIHFKRGEDLPLLDPATGEVDLAHAPDDLDFDVEHFNRKVVTREFNRVIAEQLARHIDPSLPGKTLVFAATDGHADILVDELKKAFRDWYGDIDDAAVKKITGSIDDPKKAIRRFRNDENPKVAVTVDLLTTGIDVPSIVNVVFVRRVNSRILYEQMLGRATRKCDEIGKETFRIFDAVGIYDALKDVTTMKPVVVNPTISMTQLFEEFGRVTEDAHRDLIRDQILVKLRQRISRMNEDARERFHEITGESPEDTLQRFSSSPSVDVSTWAKRCIGLGPLLDWSPEGGSRVPLVVSHHPDEHAGTTTGYGRGEKPEDYIAAFATFIRDNQNKIAALQVVTQRPRELTRAALKELAMALDAQGFSEPQLRAAFRDARNEDIAARLVGYVRQAALGSALIPWEDRVHRATLKILARNDWAQPQRVWLQRIAKRVADIGVADPTSLDEDQFRAEGGFKRLNKILDGQLNTILADINDEAWREVG